MAKVTRFNGNLKAFASEALGLERTIFGETEQSDLLTDQQTAEFLRGWGLVGASDRPSIQDFNAAFYTISQLLVYLHQVGVAEWNQMQEYFDGSYCTDNGDLYRSTTTNTDTRPSTNATDWRKITDSGNFQSMFDSAFGGKTTVFSRSLLLQAGASGFASALGVPQIGEGSSQVRTNANLDARYLQEVPTTYQAIGSFIMATFRPESGLPPPGGTTAGSNLYPASSQNNPPDAFGSLSGTWRLMGAIEVGTGVRDSRTSLWQRVS